ncbi:hypothetical protein D3C78_1891000 [compost metagenome]
MFATRWVLVPLADRPEQPDQAPSPTDHGRIRAYWVQASGRSAMQPLDASRCQARCMRSMTSSSEVWAKLKYQ